jgi:hypothetical protein
MLNKLFIMVAVIMLIAGIANAQVDDTVHVFGGSPLGDADTIVAIINTSRDIPIFFQTQSESTFIADLHYPLGINNCFVESFDMSSCQYYYPFTEWDTAEFGLFENDNESLAFFHGTYGECTWDSYAFIGAAMLYPWSDNPFLHTDPDDPPLQCLTYRVNIADDTEIHDQISCNAIGFGYQTGDILDPVGNEVAIVESYACYHFVYLTWLEGTVADENNQPVADAVVWIAGTENYDTTDAGGQFSLTHNEPGEFAVAVLKPGYQFDVVGELQFPSGDTVSLDIDLEPFDGYYYLVGDANMGASGWAPQVNGGDVTYLVNYFRALPSSPGCHFDGFWASADANGDCLVLGNDVTRIISYLRGIIDLSYCEAYTPAWLDQNECPQIPVPGWPGCE